MINRTNSIRNADAATMLRLSGGLPQHGAAKGTGAALKGHGKKSAADAISLHSKSSGKEEVHEKFTQFVGETFYGQMLKSMRSTVGKPAYFNGGRGEQVFQGQLDQTMAQEMTKASASKLADPMFERQFPNFAEKTPAHDLGQLSQLMRR
jgi:Rod binding domain-containing protein